MLKKPDTCRTCPLYLDEGGHSTGFLRPDGAFNKGVLIVGEAAGEQEAEAGYPFVGKSGHFLFNNLKRVGLNRDDFRIANVLSCRPPNNKLVGMSYENHAISHCSPILDTIIHRSREEAREKGQHFTILTLGRTAFKRVMRLHEHTHALLLKLDYLNYPFWSEEYGAWVIAADHPSYLMRGNHHLVPLLQFAAHRAVEIARDGFSYAPTSYLLDPPPAIFRAWVDGYFRALAADPLNTYLSYDIETPMKRKKDEEEVSREDDDDYTILRVSFSYVPHKAVSVRWSTEYQVELERLLSNCGPAIGWNSNNYDDPRVKAQISAFQGSIDGMLAWHVLNTNLPKGLGFVAPFYAKRTAMWKHLSEEKPAFYNAVDADVALQCWLGIMEGLKSQNLWEVFDTHVIQLNKVFAYMSSKGVLRDEAMRESARLQLSGKLDEIQAAMEAVVPFSVRNIKVYQRTPSNLDGLIQLESKRKAKVCPACNAIDVKADHFKSVGVKRLKAGEVENPCHGRKAEVREVSSQLWARVEPFKLSVKSLLAYQKVKGHRPVMNPKEKRPTFDDKALLRLRKQYKDDPLYPLIGEFRSIQKLLTTYIDGNGFEVGADGRIHTQFTHNPSTLRSASQNPNLQNLPRPKGPDDPATLIRNLFTASDGHVLLARDFSGIEAVLVGYFAAAPNYIRLAKRDVHSFYTAYALHELDGRVSANDLPLLSWDDNKLFTRLAEIKREFKEERNSLYKHLVHGANFMQQARGASEKILKETGVEYETKLVKRVMDIYFELFPEIRSWHRTLLAQADRDGYLRNPFGYVHRFSRVFEWDKVGDQWQKEQGPDANAVVAFLPQSTAAGIIKDSMLRLFFNRFDEAGQHLRLLIHDELFTEVPESQVHQVDAVLKEEMERPILCMPLPPAWGMGDYLQINTEEKIGKRWAEMK